MFKIFEISKLTLILAGAFLTILANGGSAQAAGCCLERANENEQWIQLSLNFEECLRRNQERDPAGDNVLEPFGLVRWQTDC